MAIEWTRTDPSFQSLDTSSQGRLRAVHFIGGPIEVKVLGERFKVRQVPGLKNSISPKPTPSISRRDSRVPCVRRFGNQKGEADRLGVRQLLAAWVDQRFGTAAVRNAEVWEWGCDNAMNYWAEGLNQRLVTLCVQNTGVLAASN